MPELEPVEIRKGTFTLTERQIRETAEESWEVFPLMLDSGGRRRNFTVRGNTGSVCGLGKERC